MSEPLPPRPRVVYDCNIYLQSLTSRTGPSAACIELAILEEVELYWSDAVLDEVRKLPRHPELAHLGATPERVSKLLGKLWSVALHIRDVPSVYVHPIDADDSAYVDLAVAADAKLIVSRDNHLLNLTNPAKPWSAEFRQRFPTIEVLTPVELLGRLKRENKQS
jgi:putative PIN family toxin of toxin-antitoxin system